MKNSRFLFWLIIGLTLAALYIDLPKLPLSFKIPGVNLEIGSLFGKFPLKLGLDLQGGTQLVLSTDTSKIPQDQKDQALESAKTVIERRVNLFGVSEAIVQSSTLGDQRRILVDLPGVTDASEAANLVGKTAQLDFRQQPVSFSPQATQSAILQIFEYEKTGLSGADLKKANVVFNQSQGGGAQVAIEFTSEGAKKFAEITRKNIKKPLAIFLDEQPLSFNPPIVQQEIIGGSAVISGSFTTEQAKNLSVQLNAGALPLPISVLEHRSIGASLGKASIDKSILAGLIGLLLVMLYMGLYYRFYGIIADLALIIYTLVSIAIFKTGLFLIPPVTLTLSGIAGFILSIGMAVDANILIFERIKEEKRLGKPNQLALDLGFKRAWSSIRDSNISSLITSGILYTLGSGLVRGFALTFAIGVLVSMFSALTVTRTLLRLLIKNN